MHLPHPEGPDHEFVKLLHTFEHAAFRLEVRDRYNEPDEVPIVDRYLKTGQMDETYMDDWIEARRR